MEQYHRRSRAGCVNCRNARIKCDELRPLCRKCQSRGVHCEGYVKTLKWVTQPQTNCTASPVSKTLEEPYLRRSGATDRVDAPGVSAASSPSKNGAISSCASAQKRAIERLPVHRAHSLRLSICPAQQIFSSDRELVLFQHWWQVIPDLSFPNPKRYTKLLEEHKAMVLEFGPILLPMIVTCAAGHLASIGSALETEVLSLKQVAVETMIKALRPKAKPMPRQPFPDVQHSANMISLFSLDELSVLLSASLQLVGIEILQGSDMDNLIPLIRGAVFLVKNLSAASLASQAKCDLRYRTVLQMETRLLAYHDIMTCVPYPRRPLLPRRYWMDEGGGLLGVPSDMMHEPDVIFGFAATIMALTGECAALVEGLFRGVIDLESFQPSRLLLLDRLEQAIEALPSPVYLAECTEQLESAANSETDRGQFTIHNASISAARSHGLASQIYLLRAMEPPNATSEVEDIITRLEASVRSLPPSSPAITIMLWPFWVLGCESNDTCQGLERQEFVRKSLQMMLAKQGFMNISTCLETLETHIWSMEHAGVAKGCSAATQPVRRVEMSGAYSWVQFCFERRVRPVLA